MSLLVVVTERPAWTIPIRPPLHRRQTGPGGIPSDDIYIVIIFCQGSLLRPGAGRRPSHSSARRVSILPHQDPIKTLTAWIRLDTGNFDHLFYTGRNSKANTSLCQQSYHRLTALHFSFTCSLAWPGSSRASPDFKRSSTTIAALADR